MVFNHDSFHAQCQGSIAACSCLASLTAGCVIDHYDWPLLGFVLLGSRCVLDIGERDSTSMRFPPYSLAGSAFSHSATLSCRYSNKTSVCKHSWESLCDDLWLMVMVFLFILMGAIFMVFFAGIFLRMCLVIFFDDIIPVFGFFFVE